LLNGANTPEFLAIFWGIHRLGGVVALGNAWWSADEIVTATGSIGLRAVVSDAKRHALIADKAAFADIPKMHIEDFAKAFAGERSGGEIGRREWDEERPAVLIFTSGATGRPKPAILSHRALIACIHTLCLFRGKMPNEMSSTTPQMSLLCSTPLFHVGGTLLQLQALLSGHRLVILGGRADGSKLLQIMERERINIVSTVPTLLSRIIDHPDFEKYDLSSVSVFSAAGSMVSPDLVARARARFPNSSLSSGSTYGMTETGGSVTMIGGPDHVRKPTSAGKALATSELRIASPDESGEGEILIRTASAMTGYWGLPEANLIDADGWLHSGDLGRIDEEGFLHVTGRSKDIIIRGGENVAASVIEDRLVEHADVTEAAVIGLPHHDLGEEVGAVVVPRPGARIDPEELARFVRDALSYFQVPSRWWVHEQPLPTNAVGKVLKPLLRDNWPAGC
jgi:long-chain acyl-CoA synthetase